MEVGERNVRQTAEIAAFAASGVTVLTVTPLGDDPGRLLARVKELT